MFHLPRYFTALGFGFLLAVTGCEESKDDAPVRDVSSCDPNPCRGDNKHRCMKDENGGAVCVCDDGFELGGPRGLDCVPIPAPASPPVDCDAALCSNKGKCQLVDGQPKCTCNYPFAGPTCNACLEGMLMKDERCYNDRECGFVECNGHGKCAIASDQRSASCTCESGYLGEKCAECDPAAGLQWDEIDRTCVPTNEIRMTLIAPENCTQIGSHIGRCKFNEREFVAPATDLKAPVRTTIDTTVVGKCTMSTPIELSLTPNDGEERRWTVLRDKHYLLRDLDRRPITRLKIRDMSASRTKSIVVEDTCRIWITIGFNEPDTVLPND